MPNVLILGASGYLGLAIGQALLRSGKFIVWGLIRNPEKVKLLTTNEIFPVIGDATDQPIITKTIAEAKIDLIVDAATEYGQADAILQAVISASKARLDALAEVKASGPKLGFVYTSGSFVHGSPATRYSDLSPVGNGLAQDKPAGPVAWRPAHEQRILAARDVLDVAVLRPSAIYGRGSWVWGTLWSSFAEAKDIRSVEPVQVPADKEANIGTIHVDDAAEAYVAALERIDRLGNWPVFDILNETLSVTVISEAVKAVYKLQNPIEYAGTQGNAWLEALSSRSKADNSRAKMVLNWGPKRGDFILNMETYLQAWEAAQEENRLPLGRDKPNGNGLDAAKHVR